MAQIFWTPQAVADLAGVPPAMIDRLLTKVELLADFPLMGPAMDGPYEGFRQLLVDRHRVVYQHQGDHVRIAYIRHGARQLRLRVVREK